MTFEVKEHNINLKYFLRVLVLIVYKQNIETLKKLDFEQKNDPIYDLNSMAYKKQG